MGVNLRRGDIPSSHQYVRMYIQYIHEEEETGTIFCPPAGTIVRMAGREKVPEKNHSLCLECGALYMPNHVYMGYTYTRTAVLSQAIRMNNILISNIYVLYHKNV